MSPSDKDCRGYVPISAYALIGDCHTAALVSSSGSIDWYCPGRFDAPAVFCRILDARQGGYMSISPAHPFRPSRRYQDHTNLLETTFETAQGSASVTDLMPLHRREPDHGGTTSEHLIGSCGSSGRIAGR